MGIDKDKRLSTVGNELRLHAEERLRSEQVSPVSSLSYEDSQRLIHELQVHQIELEMQNEELRQAWDERDKMEALLGKYSDLYDFAPVGYFNLDHDGIIRAVNFNGAKALGVDRSSLVNRRLDLFLSNETSPVFHNFLDKVFASVTKEKCEVVFQGGGHSPLIVQIEAVVSETREECRAVGVDITERRQAEESLKLLNADLENRVAERTEELADSINKLYEEISVRKMAEENALHLNRLYAVLSKTDHAIVHTKDRYMLFHDFCRIAVEDGSFKLAWVGLVDETSGELEVVASYGATAFLDDIRFMSNEKLAGCSITRYSIREGSYFICNDFLASPITQSDHERACIHGIRASASITLKQEGKVIGALNLYTDIKDFFDEQQIGLLLQMRDDISFCLDNFVREKHRQVAEQALHEEIVERLRTVEDLREKEQMLILQSRQAAMGEMIGNIAHQWRQPLNTLGLTTQQLLLFYDLGGFTREFLENGVSKSMELIHHMSRTIDDFKNYFKPNKEKVEFKMRAAVLNTLSLLEGSLQTPKIYIEIVEKDDPDIFGYQNEFAQVILNIITNARDALIEKETVDPRVTITISSEDGNSVITIADNAGGIPEEIIDKIFDPYFTTKGPQRGTGVGLYMSKTIIESNMGGRLSVRNLSNGAEFRIEV